jgi:hypothetical protein
MPDLIMVYVIGKAYGWGHYQNKAGTHLRWQPSAPPNSGNVHHIKIEEGIIMPNESNVF